MMATTAVAGPPSAVNALVSTVVAGSETPAAVLGLCPTQADGATAGLLDNAGLPVSHERVLVHIPGLTDAHPDLQAMVAAVQQGKTRQSRRLAQAVLDGEAPADVQALARYVLARSWKDRSSKAVPHWEALQAVPCFSAEAQWPLAKHALRAGKSKVALERLNAIPAWHPSWMPSRLELAELQLKRREKQAARDTLLLVVPERLSRSQRARFWRLVDQLAKLEKKKRLRRYANRMLWRMSKGSERRKIVRTLRKLRSPIDTADGVEQTLGGLTTSKSSVRKVLKATKVRTRRNPGLRAYVRGVAYSRLRKRRPEAVRYLKVSTWKLKRSLHRARAHYQLGHLLGRLDRETEGYPHLEKVATLAPDTLIHEQALWRQYRMLNYLGKEDESLAKLVELERRFPWTEHGAKGRWFRAWSAYQKGEWEEAKTHLIRLVERYGHTYSGGRQPWAAQAMYWLARVEDGQGRKERARQLWSAVIDHWPMGHYGHLARMRLAEPFPPLAPTAAPTEEAPQNPLAGLTVRTAPELMLPTVLTRVGLTRTAESVLADRFGGRSPAGAGDLLYALAIRNGSTHRARYLIRYRLSHFRPPDRRTISLWRDHFETPFEAHFRAASVESGASMSLLYAIGFHESRYNPTVVSVANAIGVMQVVPSVEKEVAKALDWEPQGRRGLRDAAYNVRISAHYLAALSRMTGGNNLTLTAAYASGNHILRRWLKRTTARELDVFVETMPFASVRSYAKGVGVISMAFSRMHPEWSDAEAADRGYQAPVFDPLNAFEIRSVVPPVPEATPEPADSATEPAASNAAESVTEPTADK